MSAVSQYNRISAILVALLYVFFSTFGAVSHTHALVEPDRVVSASSHFGAGRLAAKAHHITAGQQDCAACEWQALSVTQVSAPPPHIESALLRMVPAVPVFSFDAVAIARSSSRAPPTA